MSKPKVEIIDGKIAINSKATVHDCMDFLHGLNADCKDPPTRARWNKDRCLVRVKRDKKGNNELTLRLSASYIPAIVPNYYGTTDQYGVGQFTEPGKQPSNKIDFAFTLDQAGSNFIYALFNSACHDSELLEKTAWMDDKVEEHLKDLKKAGSIVMATYVKSKCFTIHGDGPFPANVDRVKLRISVWVEKEGADVAKRLGTSYYGGAPYFVQNGGISSKFLKIAKSLAQSYIGRIKDEKLVIQKGDFANTCMRIVASHSFYSSGQVNDPSFPNIMLFSMRLTTFDISVLSKSVDTQSSVELTNEDMDRVREMGGIIDETPNPAILHDSDDELSETSREAKRARLEAPQ